MNLNSCPFYPMHDQISNTILYLGYQHNISLYSVFILYAPHLDFFPDLITP